MPLLPRARGRIDSERVAKRVALRLLHRVTVAEDSSTKGRLAASLIFRCLGGGWRSPATHLVPTRLPVCRSGELSGLHPVTRWPDPPRGTADNGYQPLRESMPSGCGDLVARLGMNSSVRPLPLCFARYMARSALWISSLELRAC